MSELQGHIPRRVSVRGAVIDGSKILAVQLQRYDEAAIDVGDAWVLPGGGLDRGESIIAALQREMVEETGVEPAIGPLLYVQQFKDGEGEFLEFIFYVTNTSDYRDIDLTQTSHGNSEIARICFIEPSKEHILPRFLSSQDLINIPSEQHPKFFSYLS